MIDERHEELASLYALDLLEGAERAQFENALARDPQLQELVRELRESAAQLAHSAPATPPPPELRARVLAAIEPNRADTPGNVVSGPWSLVSGRLLPWAVAAGFALLAGFVGLRFVTVRSERDLAQRQAEIAETIIKLEHTKLERDRLLANQHIGDLNRQIAATRAEVGTLTQRLAALTDEMKTQGDLAELKIAALVSLANNPAEALAVAVWNPAKQEGLFTLAKAPPLAPDQTLELWVIEARDKAQPVSVGVLTLNPDGSAKTPFKPASGVGAIAAFAISREKKDGRTHHATPGEVLMLGKSH